jgi:hypothetical protein
MVNQKNRISLNGENPDQPETQCQSPILLDFSSMFQDDNLVRGFIYSIILSKPKAKNRLG